MSTDDSAYSLDLNLPVAIVVPFRGVHLERQKFNELSRYAVSTLSAPVAILLNYVPTSFGDADKSLNENTRHPCSKGSWWCASTSKTTHLD